MACAQGADVHGHRGAGQLGPRARVPRPDEGYRGKSRTDRADHGRGGGQEAAAAMVDRPSVLARSKHPFLGHPDLSKSFGRQSFAAPTPTAAPAKPQKSHGILYRQHITTPPDAPSP